jgi:hypothetical protein
MSNAIEAPETYSYFDGKLEEGNNLFQCNQCGHYVGDPRTHNWRGRCPSPDCGLLCKFYRLIE